MPEASEAYDVFISYGGSDKEIPQRFYRELVERGLRPWAAFHDIPLGSEYAEHIVSAIQACRVVAVLVSAGSMASKHVFREVAEAASARKPTFPIYIDPDVSLPGGVRYYLGPLHRLKIGPSEVGRAAAVVASALRDKDAWQRSATPAPFLDRWRASPVRSSALAFGIALLSGLMIWGLQAMWNQRAQDQAAVERDAQPMSLGLLQVQTAERVSPAGPWRLRMSVTLSSDTARFQDAKLLVQTGAADSTATSGTVVDVTPAMNPAQVGGGQMFPVDVAHLGHHLTACLILPHPRTHEKWRLSTSFAGDRAVGSDGVERYSYRPSAAPRAERDDESPCR